MRSNKWLAPVGFAIGFPLLGLFVASVSTETVAQGGPPPVGGPLQGLTPQQNQRWTQGRDIFLRNEFQQTGLGPVFNGTACAQCHVAGAPGGASPNNVGVSVVVRIGATVNGLYSDLPELGGPVIQARSLREFLPNYPIPREQIPPPAQYISYRITTPTFGMGLIEAIPDAAILARSGVNQGNGIRGVANMVVNADTGLTEVGRFGWKAQISTAHAFTGEAYLNEMGITNPTFPAELRPQGHDIPPGADIVPDPEDEGGDVGLLTDFMRFNAPPNPLPETKNSFRGRQIFDRVLCASCHVPQMTTGPNPVIALSQRPVNLFSDLLLHHMGSQLADGIEQGQATGDQFRTAPLWGLRFRRFYLHDGRATTLDRAIRFHGGEAAGSVRLYSGLDRLEKLQLEEFLNRL